jgi:endonuclease YncB( thermonuclease family)
VIPLSLPLAAVALLAQTRTATVLSIGDGDTLRVREGSHTINVRLACIDAPETSQAPHGASARTQLQALAPVGSTVALRIQTTDRYGILVSLLTWVMLPASTTSISRFLS